MRTAIGASLAATRMCRSSGRAPFWVATTSRRRRWPERRMAGWAKMRESFVRGARVSVSIVPRVSGEVPEA